MNFENVELIFFALAFFLAALSAAGYLFSLLVKRVMLAKISTWILAGAFLLLTAYLIAAAINAHGFTNLGPRALFAFYAWSAGAVYLVLQFKTKTRLLGAFIGPLVLLFVIIAAGQEAGKTILPEGLQSWLATGHLALSIVGEILFVLASCAGAMFIMQNSLLKSGKFTSMSRLLPSLGDLDRINHLCLLCGFPLLTTGIIAGAFYAAFVWENLWTSDPKVIWSFIAWLVYGVLLHQRLALGWKGFRMAALSCIVFLLLLLTYILVKLCFSSLHNFV
ncbi:MAG TPA: cytochrome c biogenesis protein CcsA [Smithellaceae bacterium]|nr:cytochrome c biogenesis protein CcsA [Smithellaceae bacterium]HRS89513.1 cytochrome c biogenesis protein CcsA [Smithellaceae bacterium]HRV26463.1 cytochrome c biogenesis protein CcsA [Smithellaceae bacterium]